MCGPELLWCLVILGGEVFTYVVAIVISRLVFDIRVCFYLIRCSSGDWLSGVDVYHFSIVGCGCNYLQLLQLCRSTPMLSTIMCLFLCI